MTKIISWHYWEYQVICLINFIKKLHYFFDLQFLPMIINYLISMPYVFTSPFLSYSGNSLMHKIQKLEKKISGGTSDKYS